MKRKQQGASPDFLTGDPDFVRRARRIRKEREVKERDLRQKVLVLVGIYALLAAISDYYFFVDNQNVPLIFGILAVVFSVCMIASPIVYWGVRRQEPWSRKPLIILCLPFLIAFPFGTVIAGNFIVQLMTEDDPKQLTAQYQMIVRATPELNKGVGFLAWVVAILLTILFIWICQLPD